MSLQRKSDGNLILLISFNVLNQELQEPVTEST